MKQIALSIEQMKHLESLGLDISDASMFYTSLIKKGEYTLVINTTGEAINKPLLIPESIIPAYTLQDILEKLPELEGERCAQIIRCYSNDSVYYECSYLHESSYESYSKYEQYGDTPLEAAYNMLLWCIENNYIKTSNK